MLRDILYERLTEDRLADLAQRRADWIANQLHAGLATILKAGCSFAASEADFSRCILGLMQASPPAGYASRLINHWSTALLVSRAGTGQIPATAAAAHLGVNLLFETLPDGSSPLAGMTFTTQTDEDGGIAVLSQNGRLLSRSLGATRGVLHWECAARFVKVSVDQLFSVDIALPLERETLRGEVVFTPFPMVPRWNLPLIEGGAEALLLDTAMAPVSQSFDSQHTLCASDSLGEAHRMLQVFWPEVIDWIEALNPAFAALPTAGSSTTHYSGSFGPGIPLYLSRVSNAWFHVEDLVHEAQHQRFNLFLNEANYFPTWHDADESFISPFRVDLRPLRGLHLGLHAFLAVNELRLRALGRVTEKAFSVYELLKTHLQNVFCFETATRFGLLSEDGLLYYEAVGALLNRHQRMIEPLVTAEIQNAVQSDLTSHVEAVVGKSHARNNRLLDCAATSSPDT